MQPRTVADLGVEALAGCQSFFFLDEREQVERHLIISRSVDELKVTYGNIDRVTRVEHGASGAYMNCVHGLRFINLRVDDQLVYELRINAVVGRCECAVRGRQAYYRAVVCISPCELDGVKFPVAVLYLTGAVGDEDWSENEQIDIVCGVRLDSEVLDETG